jgi:hypothetical protein
VPGRTESADVLTEGVVTILLVCLNEDNLSTAMEVLSSYVNVIGNNLARADQAAGITGLCSSNVTFSHDLEGLKVIRCLE